MNQEAAIPVEEAVEQHDSQRRFRPYPEYRDSGVEWLDSIPSHWETRRLKNVLACKITDGPHSTPEFLADGVPFLSVDGIQNGELVFDGCRYVSQDDHQEFTKTAFPRRNDILLGKAASTGKIARVKVDFEFSIWSPLALIRVSDKHALAPFIEYALKSTGVQAQIDVLCTSNTQKNISMDDIPLLTFAMPSLDEQRAIAGFLAQETARIDELIAKKQRIIELLAEKRTALISHAVAKGLNPDAPMKDSGVDWIGPVPESWNIKRLKFLSQFVTSGSRGWAQFYSDDGAVFLRIGNLSRDSIDLLLDDIQRVMPPDSAEGKRTLAIHNDLLLSVTAYIGAVAIVPQGLGEAYVNQHTALIRLTAKHVVPRWVAYCLFSFVGQRQFQSLTYGGTKDGLGLDDVKTLTVLIPPIAEQQSIVEYLDDECSCSIGLVQRIHDAIYGLREYRSALISAAVTGKIDVRGEVVL